MEIRAFIKYQRCRLLAGIEINPLVKFQIICAALQTVNGYLGILNLEALWQVPNQRYGSNVKKPVQLHSVLKVFIIFLTGMHGVL